MGPYCEEDRVADVADIYIYIYIYIYICPKSRVYVKICVCSEEDRVADVAAHDLWGAGKCVCVCARACACLCVLVRVPKCARA